MRRGLIYVVLAYLCLTMSIVSLRGATGIPGYLFYCDVLTDLDGNFLVWGSYVNDLEFGTTTLSSDDYVSSFVAKLGRDGKWIWVRDFPCEHPYYALREDLMIWQESDGSIGVTGSFIWKKPYGKNLNIKSSEKVSLAYLDKDGQSIPLDDIFLRSSYRLKPKRPKTVDVLEGVYRASQPIVSGGYKYSAVDNIIHCVRIASGISWDIELNSISESSDTAISIRRLAPLPNGGAVAIGHYSGGILLAGGTSIGNDKEEGRFILGLNPDGSISWLQPVESSFQGYYGQFISVELLSTADGLTLISENHIENEMVYLAAVQRLNCFDTSGRVLWSLTLGSELTIGPSYFVSRESGVFFFNEGILEQTKILQKPCFAKVDDKGSIVESRSLPTRNSIHSVLDNGDIISTQWENAYESASILIVSCYGQAAEVKWQKALTLSDDGKLSGFKTVSNSSYLTLEFSGSVYWERERLTQDYQSGYMILKLDAMGNLAYHHTSWFRSLYGRGHVEIFVSDYGDVFLYGTDYNSYSIESEPPSLGRGNSFVCRIGQRGEALWLQRFDNQDTSRLSLCADRQGNCYLVGRIANGTYSFGDKQINAKGKDQVILIHFDPNGTCTNLNLVATLSVDTYIHEVLGILYFDKNQRVYVSYTEDNVDNNDEYALDLLWLIGYDPSTGHLTRKSFPLADIWEVRDIVAGPSNMVYLTATKGIWHSEFGDYDSGYLIAFDNNFKMVWKKDILCSSLVVQDQVLFFEGFFGHHGLAVDIDGHILIRPNQGTGTFIGRISNDGKVEWIKHGYEFGGDVSKDGFEVKESTYDFWVPDDLGNAPYDYMGSGGF